MVVPAFELVEHLEELGIGVFSGLIFVGVGFRIELSEVPECLDDVLNSSPEVLVQLSDSLDVFAEAEEDISDC